LEKPRQISPHEVESALQRQWWKLKLPPALETVFETETGPERCRHLIVYGIIGLLLYDVYLLSDLRLIPDQFGMAALVRLGIVTPLALGLLGLLRRNPPPVLREALQAVMVVVYAASILWLTVVSDAPTHVHRHVGVLVILVFANVILRLRFWYALGASVASLAMYAVVVWHLQDMPLDSRTTAVVLLANTVLFTLMAAHTLERDARREFLFRMQDRLRRNELEKMAHRDSLTGLGNRRQLDQTLDTLWPVAEAGGESVALLMLDIDEFKAFNDRYGHLAGDVCLKRVGAAVAAESRRSQDIAVRFGGEELVMVLTGVGLSDGIAVAERIRRSVAAIGIPHEDSLAGVVTVSIGVTAGVPGRGLEQHAFLAAADAALYAAKRNGRNQVWPPAPDADRTLMLIAEDLPIRKVG
jgi:diguanylate cyclase (GGDEF)-like protein